jgi:hypothetical protein
MNARKYGAGTEHFTCAAAPKDMAIPNWEACPLARWRAFAQLIWRAAVAIGACFAEPLVLHRGDLEPQDILRRLIAETGAISELSARFLPDDTGRRT